MALDTVFGLPVHALVVHAVVVLVPLAAAGTAAVSVSPRLRARYGSLVALVALASLVLVPVATSSGEELERRVTETDLVDKHTQMGEQLLPFVAVMAAAVVVLLVVERVRTRRGQDSPSWAAAWVPTVAVLLAVTASAGSLVQVARIGHSGARAVWHTAVASR